MDGTRVKITRAPAGSLPPEKIRQALIDGDFVLEDVIDAVIETNGIVGVGLFSLADYLKAYVTGRVSRS